jgi:hypothetical protein
MPSERFYFGFQAKIWESEEVYQQGDKPTSYHKFAAKTKR